MLTPEYLQGAPAELEELYLKLEEEIIADICRRIAKAGYVTDTAEYQILRLKELGAGTEYIKQKIKEYSGLSDEMCDRLFFDAAQVSDEFYSDLYSKANVDYTPYEYNDFFQQTVDANVNQTKGTLRNMTGSMGFSYRGSDGKRRFHSAAEAYRDCLDYAFMQVESGVVDYTTAVRNATRRLTESGLQFVDYESGVVNHVDVAVRRAVLTGISQVTGQIAEHNMQELDTDIVEVDAHPGARPDHALWQGRWFSFSGTSTEYPSLRAVTGYGTVTGLKGANCRHDFYPVIVGISEPMYTEEELANIDSPPFSYKGKEYTAYEATQHQRYMERAMRKTKREILAAEKSGDDDMFTAKSVLLRRQREEYKNFSKAADLLTQNERTQVYGFGRSQASRSTAVYKKVLTLGNGDVTMGLRVNNFRNALADGKINTTVDTHNQPKHVYGKVWKNQVKQSIKNIHSGRKATPRSVLAKGLDPQKIIDKYAGQGDYYEYRDNNKYPDEFITVPYVVGRTYNKKTGKYEATNRVQIKYNENKGTHVFPTLRKETVT